MILRDYIKEAKTCIKEGHYTDAVRMLNDALDEMQEEESATVIDIRTKVLKKLNQALENDDPDGAYTLAQLLEILPD